LELYKNKELETMLKIETGIIEKSFKSPLDFINDLEHKWKLYKINYFKRIQSPPIIAVSRRAFGFDLRESQNGVYFTKKYKELKEELLK
jgi:NAD+ synthase (glutamine-hydrolysing)